MNIQKAFATSLLALVSILGGGLFIDKAVQLTNQSGEVQVSIFQTLINFIVLILSIPIYFIQFVWGAVLSLFTALESAILLFASIFSLLIDITIFVFTHLTTSFLLYEFFVLAICIQMRGDIIDRFSKFFGLHWGLILFVLSILTFIIRIPNLIINLFTTLLKNLYFIWVVISDILKIIADLIPFT